ncbi:unnamed protein product [Mycena citricolor]|uniref:Uncharacterized protein n=1 Tax=Mycena citricolor TaxID=2018698 RepID=A0AAD2JZN5_9AGAR|nr:unnamed protein product [Mycena citricolor]
MSSSDESSSLMTTALDRELSDVPRELLVEPDSRLTMDSGSTCPIPSTGRDVEGGIVGVQRFVKVAFGGIGNAKPAQLGSSDSFGPVVLASRGFSGPRIALLLFLLLLLHSSLPTGAKTAGSASTDSGKVRHRRIGDRLFSSVYRGCRRRLWMSESRASGSGGAASGLAGMVIDWAKRRPSGSLGMTVFADREGLVISGGSNGGEDDSGRCTWPAECCCCCSCCSCCSCCAFEEPLEEPLEPVGESGRIPISNGCHPFWAFPSAIASRASFEMSRTPSRITGWPWMTCCPTRCGLVALKRFCLLRRNRGRRLVMVSMKGDGPALNQTSGGYPKLGACLTMGTGEQFDPAVFVGT